MQQQSCSKRIRNGDRYPHRNPRRHQSRDAELARIVNLVGPEALSSAQRWALVGAALIKEGVLQQNALDEVDSYCAPARQYELLNLMITIYEKGAELIQLGVPVQELSQRPLLAQARRCKSVYPNESVEKLQELTEELIQDFHQIRLDYAKFGEHKP